MYMCTNSIIITDLPVNILTPDWSSWHGIPDNGSANA